jgi:hypothetical protein
MINQVYPTRLRGKDQHKNIMRVRVTIKKKKKKKTYMFPW